jgi:protease IV
MKSFTLEDFWISRAARVAIAAAILTALAAIAFDNAANGLGALALLAGAGLVAAFYTMAVRPARIPRDAVITLRIAGLIREHVPPSLLDQLRGRGQMTLFHLREALGAAAADPDVRAVLVEIASPEIGLATAQELRDLLRAVHGAGKRVVALLTSDSVSVRDYLLACGASEIVANPDAALMMLGVAAGSIFLKGAFEKLRIETQTLQWKEYKGFGEIFSRERMSPALRESLEAIIADWKRVLVDNISASRNLPPGRVSELVGSGFFSVRTACEAGLLDRAGYIEDLRKEFDPKGEDKSFVSLGRYLHHAAWMRERGGRARLALIHGIGPVIAGEPPAAGEFISGEATADEIRRAAKDESVRAIVFRVNSPGGSAVGSDMVWRAVREAQAAGKPVVVSMGDVAGSGGYYVATGADAIVAEPATVTGSIGVVYTKFNLKKLLGGLGISIDLAKSDESSDALSLSRAMTEAELMQLNEVVGELYANFTAKVSEGRKLDAERTEELARGRVWSGTAARARGLVDELGGLKTAIDIAREKAGLAPHEEHELVLYPPPTFLSTLSLMRRRAGVPLHLPLQMDLAGRLLGVPGAWAPAMITMLGKSGAYLLCPFF